MVREATKSEIETEAILIQRLRTLESPLLAFSGGVDSSYLLWALVTALGRKSVRAVLGVSSSLSGHQREQARSMAAHLDVVLQETPTSEMELEDYRRNLGDRCFHCKDTLFATLRREAPNTPILDGTNADDLEGHRPGVQAAERWGVQSPLAELGLKKASIRALSARHALPSAELPASPCLASRVPAGTPVSEEALRRIEAGEALLRKLVPGEFRVRHHGDLARIEVPLEVASGLLDLETRETLTTGFRAIGYRFITLDLEGFRSGSSSLLV